VVPTLPEAGGSPRQTPLSHFAALWRFCRRASWPTGHARTGPHGPVAPRGIPRVLGMAPPAPGARGFETRRPEPGHERMPAVDLSQAGVRDQGGRSGGPGWPRTPRKVLEVGDTAPRSVRFSPAVWALLEKRAKAKGLTLHAALRQAIVTWARRSARRGCGPGPPRSSLACLASGSASGTRRAAQAWSIDSRRRWRGSPSSISLSKRVATTDSMVVRVRSSPKNSRSTSSRSSSESDTPVTDPTASMGRSSSPEGVSTPIRIPPILWVQGCTAAAFSGVPESVCSPASSPGLFEKVPVEASPGTIETDATPRPSTLSEPLHGLLRGRRGFRDITHQWSSPGSLNCPIGLATPRLIPLGSLLRLPKMQPEPAALRVEAAYPRRVREPQDDVPEPLPERRRPPQPVRFLCTSWTRFRSVGIWTSWLQLVVGRHGSNRRLFLRGSPYRFSRHLVSVFSRPLARSGNDRPKSAYSRRAATSFGFAASSCVTVVRVFFAGKRDSRIPIRSSRGLQPRNGQSGSAARSGAGRLVDFWFEGPPLEQLHPERGLQTRLVADLPEFASRGSRLSSRYQPRQTWSLPTTLRCPASCSSERTAG